MCLGVRSARQHAFERLRGNSSRADGLRVVLASLACAIGLAGLATGCATIPKEAPELSLELGRRISAIEVSHLALLGRYFDEKRASVDRYIDEVWIPTYSEEVMSEPAVAAIWTRVCREGTDRDRLEFLSRIGPRIQRRINEQRRSMIAPLDELERAIAAQLGREYDQTRAINGTLTSFLASAAEVDANRRRYLEMLGLHDEKVAGVLEEVDEVVDDLSRGLEKAAEASKKAEDFRQRMQGAVAKARATFSR